MQGPSLDLVLPTVAVDQVSNKTKATPIVQYPQQQHTHNQLLGLLSVLGRKDSGNNTVREFVESPRISSGFR